MTIRNNGTLEADKRFTDEALSIIYEIFKKRPEDGVYDVVISQTSGSSFGIIDVNDLVDSSLDDKVAGLIAALLPLDIHIKGSITYYGDDDGAIWVERDTVMKIDMEEYAIRTASVYRLLQELQNRGFTVTLSID